MDLLYYSDLDYKKAGKQFEKVVEQLARSDFRSADVKKMPGTGYYRARVDKENRLLFRFARHGSRMYLLLLEVIYNHEYHKSRFLRGAKVDEAKFIEAPSADVIDDNDIAGLNYVNPSDTKFHLLDKVISFDEYQEQVFHLRLRCSYN